MEPWTAGELKQFAPSAADGYVTALTQGWPDIVRTLDTPLRLCEALAQWAHETGGFTILIESLDYRAARMCEVWPDRFKGALDPRAIYCAGNPERLAEAVYGGRLGNDEKGDGLRYCGRGLDQCTGKDAYREASSMIGVDLVANPELLANPAVSLRVALARWRKLKLNTFADRHYTRAIGNAINRGNPYHSKPPIGHASRLEWFGRAWALFGDGETPQVKPGMALGAHGAEVKAAQGRLASLGYGIGAQDSIFGPTMARAVVAFKHDHKTRADTVLEPDEVIGPATWAALSAAEPMPVSPEREATTVGDLIAKGSTEAVAGKQQQRTGEILALTAAVGGAEQSGAFSAMQQQLAWVPPAKDFLIPVIEAVRWGFKHVFWLLLLGIAVWVWRGGVQTQIARLKAHVRGFNLSR